MLADLGNLITALFAKNLEEETPLYSMNQLD